MESGAVDMGEIGSETKIPQTTRLRMKCLEWRPVGARHRHLRIFTTEEEIAIPEFIVANYIIPRALCTVKISGGLPCKCS
jgi:hypothetical protein